MISLPLAYRPEQALAWHDGAIVTHARFAADVAALSARLPDGGEVLNLCENRYHFMTAFAAAAGRRQLSLLPTSRAPAALNVLRAAHPGCVTLCDEPVAGFEGPVLDVRAGTAAPDGARDARAARVPFDAAAPAILAHTSGSSGASTAHLKTWSELCDAARLSSGVLARHAGCALPLNVIATVPAQHMYGLEFSVMLPLAAGCAAHAGRPLFFDDLARTLAQLPAPRLLLTTPLHLKKVLEAGVTLPQLALVVSATAPLAPEDADAAEQRFGAPVCEVYGCTEAGSVATRRTSLDEPWSLHPGLRLEARGEHFAVSAPHLPAPAPLADRFEVLDGTRFHLLGRNTDMLKVAGKRASLSELTRQLLAIPGVRDAVVFVPDRSAGEPRPAALVEAPGVDERDILVALAAAVDPVFVPRPLRKVAALPRDSLGKLSRAALLELLGRG